MSRWRASGRGAHGDDRGGGDAGAEDGRAGEGDDGDANLPQLGPRGPPDPPVRSLPELACPLSPSPLAHCELQQMEIGVIEYIDIFRFSSSWTVRLSAGERAF